MNYNTVTQGNICYSTPFTGTSSVFISASASNTYPLDVYGAINLSGVDADILINGHSLKDTLEKINQRLLILRPDPEYLEKYQALKNAYEHYKMLEALCFDTKK